MGAALRTRVAVAALAFCALGPPGARAEAPGGFVEQDVGEKGMTRWSRLLWNKGILKWVAGGGEPGEPKDNYEKKVFDYLGNPKPEDRDRFAWLQKGNITERQREAARRALEAHGGDPKDWDEATFDRFLGEQQGAIAGIMAAGREESRLDPSGDPPPDASPPGRTEREPERLPERPPEPPPELARALAPPLDGDSKAGPGGGEPELGTGEVPGGKAGGKLADAGSRVDAMQGHADSLLGSNRAPEGFERQGGAPRGGRAGPGSPAAERGEAPREAPAPRDASPSPGKRSGAAGPGSESTTNRMLEAESELARYRGKGSMPDLKVAARYGAIPAPGAPRPAAGDPGAGPALAREPGEKEPAARKRRSGAEDEEAELTEAERRELEELESLLKEAAESGAFDEGALEAELSRLEGVSRPGSALAGARARLEAMLALAGRELSPQETEAVLALAAELGLSRSQALGLIRALRRAKAPPLPAAGRAPSWWERLLAFLGRLWAWLRGLF